MKGVQWSIQEVAAAVNDWCREHSVYPVNGQASEELSVRTLRYYRTSGLLDAPRSGAGRGYGQRHFFQLAAIRILQAQGLPLTRIQQLLFGRSDAELQKIANSVRGGGTAVVSHAPISSRETWTTYPVSERIFLVAREGAHLSDSQLTAIHQILDEQSTPSAR